MAGSTNPHLTLSSSSAPTHGGDADIRISAIDIGSNSIRQTIADVSPTGTIRVVDELKAVAGVAGIHVMGLGHEDPVRRVIDAAGLLPRPAPS